MGGEFGSSPSSGSFPHDVDGETQRRKARHRRLPALRRGCVTFRVIALLVFLMPFLMHSASAEPQLRNSSQANLVLRLLASLTGRPSLTMQPPKNKRSREAAPTNETSLIRSLCGRRFFRSRSARIVGGSESEYGKWPWQLSLRIRKHAEFVHKCGATLLNRNWAITAGHCVDKTRLEDFKIRFGEYDLTADNEPYPYVERRLRLVASHPNFNPRTYEYDLALLRFDEPVQFKPNIIPICLPEDDNAFLGESGYVTGWGRLYGGGPLPTVIQEVRLPVMNNTFCEDLYEKAGLKENIPSIFLCAGFAKGGRDACEGDSGGPFVMRRQQDSRWMLAGVISWGIGCAEPNKPGVYTRVSEFRSWINQMVAF